MLSATVEGSIGRSGSPLRNAAVTGAAPSACTPSIRGVRGISPSVFSSRKPFQTARNRASVAHRNRHPIRGLPTKLFADFQARRFLPFHQVRVDAGVAVVPAPFLARALAQLKRVLIAAAHAQHGRAEDEQLRDLRLRRALGNEDHGFQAHGRRHPRARRRRVAGTGARDDRPPLFARFHHAHGTGAVLQRSGGIAAVIFQKEAGDAQVTGQRRRASQRRAAHGESREFGIRADGKQFAVSPVRRLAPAGQSPPRQEAAYGRVIVLDIENPSDAATRAGVSHAGGIHRFTKQAFQTFNKIHVPLTLSDVTA